LSAEIVRLWLVAPLLIPLASAVLLLASGRWPRIQRGLSLAGVVALLAVNVWLFTRVLDGGILTLQVGDWPAPFGITLVVDLLSASLLVTASLVGVCVNLYSLTDPEVQREGFTFHPLFQFQMMGVCGIFITGDLFNFYVWLEVTLVASFVLLVMGGRRGQVRSAVQYLALNILSSTLFLCAIAILYGEAGTLNMAHLAERLWLGEEAAAGPAVTVVAGLFILALGIKAALFPLYFWLPAAYPNPTFAVSALFAGLLTKVGVYGLLRLFTLVFVQEVAVTHGVLWGVALLTMLSGTLGALAQRELRHLLSYQVIGHMGFMVLGLGLYTVAGLAAAVFYLVHDMLVKTALFLVAGLVRRLRGTNQLAELGGLYRDAPGTAVLFLVVGLSLAGLPPFSGFFAKLAVVMAALGSGDYLGAAVALAADLLTLLAVAMIWNRVFWQPLPADARGERGEPTRLEMVSVGVLALAILGLGLGAGPALLLAERIAGQLLAPDAYIQAVLGEG